MISPERWQSIQPILDGALELADDAAAAYLDRACGTDAALRSDVERLLAAARRRPGLLDRPVDAIAAGILAAEDSAGGGPGPLAPGQAVGPYRVVRRIGQGGMGVVYLARDARLDRDVALKLLPPWLAADETAVRRFTNEARAASALDHPNIATVHDIGTAGDGGRYMYIAMAYYDGETLETRARRGPLPVEQARALASQVADGLRAAHARGIVHRDIKPSNVIVTREGVAKIVDFGVAKMASHVPTTPDVAPGTVSYMSPEQTAGGDVDARSDIWAVGVLLYEMLTGRRPFDGDGHAAVIAAIRHDTPAPITDHRADVPRALADAIAACLRKDPAERISSADDLIASLRGLAAPPRRAPVRTRWVAGSIAAASLVLLAGAGMLRDGASSGNDGTVPDSQHRIAVLPLQDAGTGSTDTWFAAGMTGEIIARLSRLRELSVIGQTSVVRSADPDRSPSEIARALDVRSIVEGDVSVEGDRARVAVRLLDAASRQRQWSEEYDVALVDVPGVQRDIAERVATALQVAIDAADRRALASGGTRQAEAYRGYLRGRYWLGRGDPSAASRARDEFQAALDLDPTFALAWVGLSDALDHLAGSGLLSSEDAYPRARAAAERALDLDPDLAEAHTSLAMALTSHDWDNELAERHFRRALDLSPGYARAHRTYATHLRNLCRLDEALVEAQTAETLDPLDYYSHHETTLALYFGRRYEEAVRHAEGLVRQGFAGAHLTLALALAQESAHARALTALDAVHAHPQAGSIRAYVYGRMGRLEDARRILESVDEGQPGAGFLKAVVHVALEEPDAAIQALEQAYGRRTWLLRLLQGEPVFDPLRGDPRFDDLLQRVGLSDTPSCGPDT